MIQSVYCVIIQTLINNFLIKIFFFQPFVSQRNAYPAYAPTTLLHTLGIRINIA